MRISDWSSDVCSSDREGFFQVGLAEAEPGVLGEAVSLGRDAEEILIELFVPILVVIECDRIAAGGGSLQAEQGFAFAGLDPDAVEAGALLQESVGIVAVKDCRY